VGLLLLWRLAHSPQRLRWLAVAGALTVVLALAFGLDPRRGPGHRLMPKERQAVDLLYGVGPALHAAATDRLPHVVAKETTKAIFGTNLESLGSLPFALAACACLPLLVRRHRLWGLLVLVFLLQWLLFFFEHRYFLAVMPLWVYAWWLGARWVHDRVAGGRRHGAVLFLARFLFAGLMVLYVGGNLIRDGKVLWQQRRADPLSVYEDGRYRGVPELGRWLRVHTPAGATILMDDPMLDEAVGFFSRRHVIARDEYRAPPGPAVAAVTYVVSPVGAATAADLRAHGLRVGEAIGQVPRGAGAAAWVVTTVTPARP
jgi:hypothetical protein